MKKYHINPETGRPNQCTATVYACKYAVAGEIPEHYDSKEEARAAYEKQMKDKTFENSLKKTQKVEKSVSNVNDEGETIKPYSVKYTIPAENYHKAVALIDKLNTRLEKAGISDRFEYTETEREIEERIDGFKIVRPYHDFEINTPTISLQNEGKTYTFEAVMSREGDGIVTRAGRGVELQGWKPDNLVCDHCGHKRPRNKTFIIKDPNGERKQIGSTCVSAYLGVKVNGLWALELDPLEKEGSSWGSMTAAPKHSTKDILSLALVASNMGESFISNKKAEEWGTKSTADMVNWIMRPEEEADEFNPNQISKEEYRQRATQIKENGQVDEFLEKLKKIDVNSDYTSNLNVLSNSEYIPFKSRKLLVSGIVAVKKAEWEEERKKKQAEAAKAHKENFTPGHFGKVNEKIEKGTSLTLEDCRPYSSYDYYGNPITKYRIVAKDSEGHQVMWFSANEVEDKKGSEIKLSSGSVKEHGKYKDVDQTVLTRVRMMKKK